MEPVKQFFTRLSPRLLAGAEKVKTGLAPHLANVRQHAVPIVAGAGGLTVGYFWGSHHQLRKQRALMAAELKRRH
jgi:hypothetical protein